MHCAFQDQEYLYLVIDYLSGGDLRYYQTYHLKFQEDQLSIFFILLYRVPSRMYCLGIRIPSFKRDYPPRY